MERRKFIQYSLAGLATAALPISSFSSPYTPSEEVFSDPKILSLLVNKDEVLTVGKVYRNYFPIENNKEILKNNISKSGHNIEKLVEKDFETGRTVIINGWVLSITEARQCALYSIIHSEIKK